MSDLLKKFQSSQKEFTAKETESHSFTITNIKSTKNVDRVMVIVKELDEAFFCFRNVFTKGVPVEIPTQGLSATFTLAENKEYVNVTNIDYRLEDIGAFSLVATQKLAVKLN